MAALLIPACGGGGGGGGGAPLPPPSFAPTALAVTDASNDQIDLAWTDANPDESGSLVERAPDAAGAPGPWSAAGTVGADVTVFSDTGRPALSTWWYRVSAFNAGGSTASSVPVSGTTTNTAAWMGLGGSSWGVGHGTRIRTGSGTGGGVSNSGGSANGLSFALDSTGRPIVAWPDQGTLYSQIYLKRWDGSQWAGLGGSDSGNGLSNVTGRSSVDPSLKVDASDRPVAAWSAGGEIYLKRWNGSAWVELGGSATAGGVSANAGVSLGASLALDGSGNPVVAWQDRTSGNAEIYLKRWNGTSWVELGGSATAGGISGTATDSQEPSLGLDPSGNPHVAWTEQTGLGATEAVYVKSWNGSSWVELAGSASGSGMSNTAGRAGAPSLAVDASGRPVLAYLHVLAAGTDVFLKLWDGAQWTELGGSASGGGISGNLLATPGPLWPSLALGPAGIPAVSWVHWSGGYPHVYFRRWDGAQWAELGGSGAGSGVSDAFNGVYEPVVAVDSSGNPTLGWHGDDPGIRQVYVRQWDGAQWRELGTTSAGAGGVSRSARRSEEPSLSMDASGRPIVAWQDGSSGNYEIYLRRWDGTQWAELGGSATGGGVSNTPGASRYLSMALDPAGNPVIAWQEAISWSYVYVKRWNGSQWVELGGSASGFGISGIVAAFGSPSISVDPAGNPMVAWCEEISGIRQVYVKKWNGSAWTELGGSATGGGVSAGTNSSDYAVLASDSAGNPVVAWNYYSTNAEIYLRAWSGSAWVEIGGSATGGGASSTSGSSRYPDLVVDASDRPVLVWQEFLTTNEEVYLKRWNGSAWVALGGSATSGGISASAGHSTGASIALDALGNPIVAWDDRTAGNREVHLRRWDGAAWAEFLASSATAGGISNSDGSAYTVSLSSAGGSTGVAWVGWGLTACEVYFRRAAGP